MESFRWNAVTVPIIVLFIVTQFFIVRCLVTRTAVRLNDSVLFVWTVLLVVAWVCKLLGSSNYW